MNDRKLTPDENMELIGLIVDPKTMLSDISNKINKLIFGKTEEPSAIEKIIEEEKDNKNIPTFTVDEPKIINETVEEQETKNEIEVEDDDPNTANIYRKDALEKVELDLKERKDTKINDKYTEDIEETNITNNDETSNEESSVGDTSESNNDPWGSAEGIKHVTPGQN